MNNEVTVVMYHYVRNFKHSRYPGIKGLSVNNFIKQLKFLKKTHSFVTVEECLEQLNNPKSNFPEKAVLLTFDDGYLEHFSEVFPILQSMNIQGAFFPPVKSTIERKALDVNKIHFILASQDNKNLLLILLKNKIEKFKNDFNLLSSEEYFQKISKNDHPYDPRSVTIFKRVLQRELPKKAREKIVSDLFQEVVQVNEDVLVEELYMKEKHLKCMMKSGMYIGGHGYNHEWLNTLDNSEQMIEVQMTKSFLKSIGANTENWVMCYPYGAYNDELIDKLKLENCVMALTINNERAVLTDNNRYKISRLDTNEIN